MSIWYAGCSFGSFIRKYERTEKYFGRIQNWNHSHRKNNCVTVGFFKVGEKKKKKDSSEGIGEFCKIMWCIGLLLDVHEQHLQILTILDRVTREKQAKEMNRDAEKAGKL